MSDAMITRAFETWKSRVVGRFERILMEVEEEEGYFKNQTMAANYFTKFAETLEKAQYTELK